MLTAFVAMAALGGCSAVGVLSHKLVGEPDVPAQYTPPRTPMLVLVENYRNPSASMLDAQQLAGRITDALRRYNVAPVVDADKLEAIRSDPGFSKMTIPAVARAAGAKQMLYVNVGRFDVEQTVGGEMIKASSEMNVRVVDAATGETRWPTDSSTHPLSLATPWLRRGEGADETSLRDQMTRQAATYIVRLFRKYSPDEEQAEMAVQ